MSRLPQLGNSSQVVAMLINVRLTNIFTDVYHQPLSPVKAISLIILALFRPRYSITALHPIVPMNFSQSTLQDNMSVGI